VTAGTPSLTVPGARRLRLPARLETHALSLALLAVFALVVAVEAPGELVQDSWLTLVAGREIAHHGLPQHDTLYALTAGHRWIDQQWLAQLAFYGLAVLGGLRLVLIAHAACLVGAAAILVGAARRRGASSAAVLLTGFVCLLTAPWALQMRAQSIAELLFAACFALLLEERPGARRVAGVLALLVLWANVHGSVLLGVGFAVLRAAFLIARRQRGLGIFLALTAPACVFVSPYGLALGGYYRTMLVDPKLRKYVDEWHWSTPSRHTVAFYSVLLCGALLVWRYRSRADRYGVLALAALAVEAVDSLRGIIWFGFAALPVFAPLLTRAIARVRVFSSTPAIMSGLVGAAACTLLVLGLFGRSSAAFAEGWSPGAAAAVARLAAADPRLRVVADDRFSDWLLWAEPSLRGRIAFDVRFELMPSEELAQLGNYETARRPAPVLHGFELSVASPAARPAKGRVVYRDSQVVVRRG